MKNRFSDRKWIALILFFLVVETLWLLADLQIIHLPFLSKNKVTIGATEAGHVIKVTDELKRRSSDSLVWDTTKENDVLYYNDSVLTLSRGAARLYLKDQTELQLSENTLVTLEEPAADSNSEIRLRFSKGDLKARNPVAKANILSDDWVVNLEKGAEVSLRKDKDSYEFEVISGKAQLKTKSGDIQSLTESSILKLSNDQKIQKIEKNEELQWSEKKPVRIYVFEDRAQVPLDWSGQAQNLTISKAGEKEEKISVAAQNNTDLDLKLGSYKVRLADEKGLSAARTVEILKAPRIYLKKPLPRDRLKIGESYEFIWTTDSSIKEYRLKVGALTEAVIQNFKSLTFDSEQDLEWKVEARDEEGYAMPSFYESKIYLRKDPLQAPKLKAPTLRMPEKQKGSSFKFKWWNLLISEAQASEIDSEAIFEWEPVDGADQYIIEISSDPDFRQPEVIETLKTTRFVWKKYDDKKKYFWRVAAGISTGRMGLFSEAIEFKPIIENTLVEAKIEEPVSAPVVVEKPIIEEPPPQEVVIEKIPEPESMSAKVSATDDRSFGWGLAWAPSFKAVQLKGEQNTNIELMGAVPNGLQFEFKKNDYNSKLWLNSAIWKPKSESEIPLQDNLSISEALLNFSYQNYGLSLHQSFIPLRKTDASITYKYVSVFGVRYSLQNLGLSVGTSGKVHEANLDFTYKKYLSDSKSNLKYFWGGVVSAIYQTHKDGGGSQGNLIFLLGADSF